MIYRARPPLSIALYVKAYAHSCRWLLVGKGRGEALADSNGRTQVDGHYLFNV